MQAGCHSAQCQASGAVVPAMDPVGNFMFAGNPVKAGADALMPGDTALLQPYGGPGGGHHVPAQSAFEGAPGYDANAAPAIPNSELARRGLNHLMVITPAQRAGYMAFAKTGSPLTWEAVAKIETQALVKAGMNQSMAQNTVQQAIQQLRSMGVAQPTRIPWGR